MRSSAHLRLVRHDVRPFCGERPPSARLTVSPVHADRERWDFLHVGLVAFGLAVLAFFCWVGWQITSARASSESGFGTPPSEIDARAGNDEPRSGER